MKPILSIVIANYNYGRFIEAAIRSALDQRCADVELIVVDGGSTDESVSVIRKYESKLAWWVSEKDNGQSDAFNKGFSHANGKFLTWLNADDLLVAGCLEKVVAEMKRHPECEWFTANCFRCFNDGRVMEANWGPHWYPKWLQRRNSPIVAFGPSTFFSKDLWERTGRIDERFHLAMDTELWKRFITIGIKQRRINAFVWAFRMHEDSKTAEFGEHRLSEKQWQRFHEEDRMMIEKTGHRPSKTLHIFILLLRLLDGSFAKRWWLRRTFRNFDGIIPVGKD